MAESAAVASAVQLGQGKRALQSHSRSRFPPGGLTCPLERRKCSPNEARAPSTRGEGKAQDVQAIHYLIGTLKMISSHIPKEESDLL